jgi:hypothetical protein
LSSCRYIRKLGVTWEPGESIEVNLLSFAMFWADLRYTRDLVYCFQTVPTISSVYLGKWRCENPLKGIDCLSFPRAEYLLSYPWEGVFILVWTGALDLLMFE